MQPLGRSLPASTRAACPSRDSDSPAPFTVLAVVTIVVWALGFIVPAGEYRLDSGGVPIAGTYEPTAAAQSLGQRVEDCSSRSSTASRPTSSARPNALTGGRVPQRPK